MRRLFVVVLLLAAANAFAHAGEVHTYMGTVTMLHGDGSFMMKTTDGKEVHVATAPSTNYLRADGSAATAGDVKTGVRVVVKIAKDGKTALTVKIGAAKTS